MYKNKTQFKYSHYPQPQKSRLFAFSLELHSQSWHNRTGRVKRELLLFHTKSLQDGDNTNCPVSPLPQQHAKSGNSSWNHRTQELDGTLEVILSSPSL